MKKVSEIMTSDVVLTSPDESICDAASSMAKADVGSLPVGENDRLVGMITDRDIVLRAVAQGRDAQTPVRDVMTGKIQYCFDDENVDDVAKNMAEARHFVHILRVAPRSDALVLLTCFSLTVLFDMVIAVSVGVVLAALLFMKRMAELSETKLDTGTMARLELPEGVRLYEIAGPLFFGAAQRAMSAFDQISGIEDGGKVAFVDRSFRRHEQMAQSRR